MTTNPDACSTPDGPMVAGAVPLTALGTGRLATVLGRLLPADEAELLDAMGLGDGVTVRVCRGGARCIVQVSTTRLALARDVARRVLVLPSAPTGDRADDPE